MQILTFQSFTGIVNIALSARRERLQFKNLLEDPRTADRADLPAYEFQDADPGYSGNLSREGIWTIQFNGYTGTGPTFRQADRQMQFEESKSQYSYSRT